MKIMFLTKLLDYVKINKNKKWRNTEMFEDLFPDDTFKSLETKQDAPSSGGSSNMEEWDTGVESKTWTNPIPDSIWKNQAML